MDAMSQEHLASLPHAEQVLAAALSVLRMEAAVEGWLKERRCSPCGNDFDQYLIKLASVLHHIASKLAVQAEQSTRAALLTSTPGEGGAGVSALSALLNATGLLGEALTARQRWQSSSLKAALEGKLDIDAWLLDVVGSAARATALLLGHIAQPQVLEKLCHNPNLFSSLAAALCMALQVQAKAVTALDGAGLTTGPVLSGLAMGLSYALRLSSNLSTRPYGVEGPLPVAPYFQALAAMTTLLRLVKSLPETNSKRISALVELANGFCWQLEWQPVPALHAGAAELLAASCRELPFKERMGWTTDFLSSVHDGETDATALGCIPLLRLVAEGLARRLVQQSEGPLDAQAERQLSIAAVRVLKRCCTLVDAAARTSFAALDAGLEADGAARLRQLLTMGQSNAADEVRVHVWGQRADTLLPCLQCVVRGAVQFVVCTPKVSSGRTGPGIAVLRATDNRLLNGSWVPLCPLAALESEVDRFSADGSCHSPTCCIALVAEGSKLVVCRGCGLARYCSASCAQGDWRRHGPVCRALRQYKGHANSQTLASS